MLLSVIQIDWSEIDMPKIGSPVPGNGKQKVKKDSNSKLKSDPIAKLHIKELEAYVVATIKAKQSDRAVATHEMTYPNPADVFAARLKAEEAHSKLVIDKLNEGLTTFSVSKSMTNKAILYNALTMIESRGGWSSTKVMDLGGEYQLRFQQFDAPPSTRHTYRRQPGEACVWG
jgi:hypothetical protein